MQEGGQSDGQGERQTRCWAKESRPLYAFRTCVESVTLTKAVNRQDQAPTMALCPAGEAASTRPMGDSIPCMAASDDEKSSTR